MESVISDYLCLSKWYDSGILSRISVEDTKLFITDYSVDNHGKHSPLNWIMLKSLSDSGLLNIIELTEKQNLRTFEIFSSNSNIRFESIAALVFAEEIRGKFISEDPEVMGFAYQNFTIPVYTLRSVTNEWQQRYSSK